MQLSNIDATLNHGHVNTGIKEYILHFSALIMLFWPMLSIIMLFLPVEWSSQIVLTLVLGNIMMLSFFVVFVYLIIENRKLKIKIGFWLKDAIEVKAYSKKIDQYLSGFGVATKIQVKFVINGKTFIKESTAKTFGGRKGYLGCYTKYGDRDIRILYSFKYDEVMVLKK